MTRSESSFHSLRVMLDALLPARAMLVVSAACDGDGQAKLACGLAHAFADAGRKTILISLYDRATGEPASYAAQDEATMFGEAAHHVSRAPKDMTEELEELRAQHDVVVAIAPPVPKDPISLQICRQADGVLLSVRLGRKITADDENTVTQLQRVSATLLGVVATHHETSKLKAQHEPIVGTTKQLKAAAH